MQRFTTAEFLLRSDYPLDALYLGGYAIECALKAVVMHRTKPSERGDAFKRLSSGARMHYAENLRAELRRLGPDIPAPLIQRLRRFAWSTDLRYGRGRRPTDEVRGLLKTAKDILAWAEREIG